MQMIASPPPLSSAPLVQRLDLISDLVDDSLGSLLSRKSLPLRPELLVNREELGLQDAQALAGSS